MLKDGTYLVSISSKTKLASDSTTITEIKFKVKSYDQVIIKSADFNQI